MKKKEWFFSPALSIRTPTLFSTDHFQNPHGSSDSALHNQSILDEFLKPSNRHPVPTVSCSFLIPPPSPNCLKKISHKKKKKNTHWLVRVLAKFSWSGVTNCLKKGSAFMRTRSSTDRNTIWLKQSYRHTLANCGSYSCSINGRVADVLWLCRRPRTLL